MSKYYLILKTADAEFRAIENCSKEILDSFVPIIELTRGRQLPLKEKDPERRKNELRKYPYEKKLEKIKKLFHNKKIFMDLTSDDSLMSPEIELLYDQHWGYKNWVDLLLNLKSENAFSEIVPSIILNASDENIESNMIEEVERLTNSFNSISYRSDIFDDNCYDDINIITEHLNNKKLYFIIDCKYVIPADINNYIEKLICRIKNIRQILPTNSEIIVSATSFPSNVTDFGNDDKDIFALSEVKIHEYLISQGCNVQYSDYGTINPKRNDIVAMAHGWVPRIDVPLINSIYYYRRRKLKTEEYSDAYKKVANDVISDPTFPSLYANNWGIQQILKCSAGSSPSSSPNFWISVRMSIHIETQVNRLKGLS